MRLAEVLDAARQALAVPEAVRLVTRGLEELPELDLDVGTVRLAHRALAALDALS